MIVNSIAFCDDKPVSVTVRMTDREAAFLVRMIGKTTDSSRNEFQSDGGEVGSEIYEALSNMVFNPYYDAGVNEVAR